MTLDIIEVVTQQSEVVTIVDETIILEVVQGIAGNRGESWAETFETVAQNLRGLNCVVQRDEDGKIESLEYPLPDGGKITKSIVRDDGGRVSQIILTGVLPDGVSATKTILRDANGKFAGSNYTGVGG